LLQKCQDDINKAVKAENARMVMEINKAIATADFASAEKLQMTVDNMNKSIEEMKERHALESKNAREIWMDELEKCKLEWEGDMSVKFADDLREKMATEKENRQKAVRMEAGKWQKALRETEDRIDAERNASFKKGVAERDLEAQRELSDLKGAANEALDKVKASAKDSLKSALSESAAQLRLAREHAAKDKEAAIKKVSERSKRNYEEPLARLRWKSTSQIAFVAKLTISQHFTRFDRCFHARCRASRKPPTTSAGLLKKPSHCSKNPATRRQKTRSRRS